MALLLAILVDQGWALALVLVLEQMSVMEEAGGDSVVSVWCLGLEEKTEISQPDAAPTRNYSCNDPLIA